jgi:hypothetical protein
MRLEARDVAECAPRASPDLAEDLSFRFVVIGHVGRATISCMSLTAMDQIIVCLRVKLSERPVTTPGVECLEAAFLSKEEANGIQMAWSSIMGHDPQRLFEEVSRGRYSVQLLTLGR